jgi:hypothetical protein
MQAQKPMRVVLFAKKSDFIPKATWCSTQMEISSVERDLPGLAVYGTVWEITP